MKKQPLKGLLTKKHIAEDARQVNLRLRVRIQTHNQQKSIRHLSLIMGNSESYLSRALRQKDHHMSLIVALSKHLNHNFIDPYLDLLPPNIRPTRRETELLKQIDDMNEQMARLIEERDMFRDAVLGK